MLEISELGNDSHVHHVVTVEVEGLEQGELISQVLIDGGQIVVR